MSHPSEEEGCTGTYNSSYEQGYEVEYVFRLKMFCDILDKFKILKWYKSV